MRKELLDGFIGRTLKAKDLFDIREISKPESLAFISKYHYLGDAKFFAKFNYGLFDRESDTMVSCATFSNPQGIVAMKGWFSMDNEDQSVQELSRLCTLPILNGSNATSYLLANSIKKLTKEKIRAVITLADDGRHSGSIYQVCNFKYYGLTDAKSDFYTADGRVNPRGATKDVQGVWLPRTRKHRYAYILDHKLKCNYQEQPRPQKGDTHEYECCKGTGRVLDRRFHVEYDCPKCGLGQLKKAA